MSRQDLINAFNSTAAEPISFRPATADDGEFSYNIYKEAIAPVLAEQAGPWNDERQRRFFFSSFPTPDSQIMLVHGVKAGCFHITEEEDHVSLGRMYIDSKFRGKGIGDLIVRLAVGFAHQVKKPLQIETLLKNVKAIEFFQHRGFFITGSNEYEFIMKHTGTLDYEDKENRLSEPAP